MERRRICRNFLCWAACAAIVLTLAGATALPWLGRWYAGWSKEAVGWDVLAFIWATVPALLVLLFCVAGLGKQLSEDGLFQEKSLRYLNILTGSVAVELALYLAGLCIFRSLLCFVVLCGTALLLLAAAVVRELLRRGIELQKDSDLTI